MAPWDTLVELTPMPIPLDNPGGVEGPEEFLVFGFAGATQLLGFLGVAPDDLALRRVVAVRRGYGDGAVVERWLWMAACAASVGALPATVRRRAVRALQQDVDARAALMVAVPGTQGLTCSEGPPGPPRRVFPASYRVQRVWAPAVELLAWLAAEE